ncbi:MAG TPA: hypothetical protein VH724_12380, partial [Candidatus Angelobacter sp.]|nr:hypothetical protein [Candidatus Angelobacter sp.]
MSTSPDSQSSSSPTPILDRMRPLPNLAKPRWHKGMSQLLVGMITVYVPFFAFFTGNFPFSHLVLPWVLRNLRDIFADDWAGARVIFNVFLAFVAALAAIAVHEGGHVVAGSLAGFRFRYVTVGPIKVDRSFRFSRRPSSQDSNLGEAAFFPAEMRNKPFRYISMSFAGPAANLISGCFVLLIPFQKSIMAGAFVAASFYFGSVNLIPFPTTTGMSDGLRVFSI